VNKVALELHVPATRIGEIVHERRRITAETALRLARYFKTNAEFWLNLQNFYDLECERRAGRSLEIERQVEPVGGQTERLDGYRETKSRVKPEQGEDSPHALERRSRMRRTEVLIFFVEERHG